MKEINYLKLSDNELVVLANSGDNLAMEVLMDNYKNFVRAKTRAYFLIGADRDDIIQEGMLGLFKAIRDYKADKNTSFKSFAELCVTRQIITAIKTATRQKHSPLNTYVSLNKPVYEDESERMLIEYINNKDNLNPEDIFIDREEYVLKDQRIREILSKFENTVFSLYSEGVSYQEIALRLGKSPKSIDNALQRIKRKIQKCFK